MYIQRMTLNEFAVKRGLTDMKLGELCGITHDAANRLRYFRVRDPGLSLALKVVRGTGGKVKPHELLSPDVRAELYGERGRP